MGSSNSRHLPDTQDKVGDVGGLTTQGVIMIARDGQVEAASPARKRRQQSNKGVPKRQSKKACRTPKVGDGISTGPGFVVPPELARLRRKSLYRDLAMFICLEELDRSIEEQIIAEGEEDEDLVETWSYYYEEFLEQWACGYHEEGFGVDDV